MNSNEAQSDEAAAGELSLKNIAVEAGRLMRYGLTGIVATAAYAFASLLAIEALGVAPVTGSVFGYAASMGVSFYGHSFYSFKVKIDHSSVLRRFLILAAASFALSTGLMWLLANVMGVSPRIAVATIAVVIPINNYVCSRLWVFRSGLPSPIARKQPKPDAEKAQQ